MEVTLEEEKFCCKLFKATVTKEEIESDFQKAYNQLNRETVIPGFRKGKAPISLLRNRYNKTVTEELKAELPIKYFKEYAKQNEIDYFEEVTIKTISLDENKGMKFSLVYETLPDLSMIDLSKISIHEIKEKVIEEKDIDAAIENLRRAYAVLSPISEGNNLEEGDLFKFDYIISPQKQEENDKVEDSKETEGNEQAHTYTDLEMELTENRISSLFVGTEPDPEKVKSFIDIVSNVKIGSETTFKMKPPFPLMKPPKIQETTEEEMKKDSMSEEEEVEITIKIKEAKKVELPEVNDDFAQMVIKESDVGKLKEKVVSELNENARENARNEMKWAILNEVFKTFTFDVPRTLLKRSLDNVKKQNGMLTKENGGNRTVEEVEEFEKKHMLETYLSTKIDLLFDHFIKKNNIEPSQ